MHSHIQTSKTAQRLGLVPKILSFLDPESSHNSVHNAVLVKLLVECNDLDIDELYGLGLAEVCSSVRASATLSMTKNDCNGLYAYAMCMRFWMVKIQNVNECFNDIYIYIYIYIYKSNTYKHT
jgi:hypothetical protein